MKRARALLALAIAAGIARLAAACIIDLDPPLGATTDAAATQDVIPIIEGPDASDGGDGGVLGVECTTAAECVPTGPGSACLAPRCIEGRCVYDVCPSEGGCPVSVCDLEGGVGECTAPADPTFLAGSISMSITKPVGELSCLQLQRCVAAVYPFVFVVDGADTITGYLVADPKAKTPRQVRVDKLGFGPTAIVASGHRIFFADRPQGTGDLQMTIGWFEVPANPYAGTIPVQRVTLPYRTTNANIPTLMPGPDGGVYLILGTTVYLFRPPVTKDSEVRYVTPNPDPLIPFTLVAPAGPDIAAVSIDAGVGSTSFSLLKNAGVSGEFFSPRGGTSTTATVENLANGQISVAGGAADEVVASVGVGALVDGSVPQVQKARLVWIVEPKSGVVTAEAGVDLMTYSPAFGSGVRVTSAPAPTDGGAVALYVNQQRNASVAQFVARDNGAGAPAPDSTRMVTLPGGPPSSFVLSASADWVYAFSVDSSGLAVNVHILRPACEAQ